MTTVPAPSDASPALGKIVADFVRANGPLGLALAVVIYLLVSVVPAQQEKQSAALDKQQAKFEQVIERLTEANRRENERLSLALDRLREAIEGGQRK